MQMRTTAVSVYRNDHSTSRQPVGFTPVGTYHRVGYKLGAWHDVAWFERRLQPERLDPPPPRPLQAVLHVL